MLQELQILTTIAGASAMFFGFSDYSFMDSPNRTVSHFEVEDYDAFDRNFDYEGRICEVGIKREELCFGTSHSIKRIELGEIMPQSVPSMRVSIPVALRISDKSDTLSVHRFGNTLVLADRETRRVVEQLNLSAPNFAEAHLRPSVTPDKIVTASYTLEVE